MAELDGDACGLSCLPEMGQDRIAQINGKTQPGWLIVTSLTPVVAKRKWPDLWPPFKR
jgi:hypothetical protein